MNFKMSKATSNTGQIVSKPYERSSTTDDEKLTLTLMKAIGSLPDEDGLDRLITSNASSGLFYKRQSQYWKKCYWIQYS